MGDMADYYEDLYYRDMYREQALERTFEDKVLKVREYTKIRYTEDILNSKRWVTAQGEVLELEAMEESHLRNTLKFLYKNRDRYWFNCRNGKLIEQFEDGDDFFQRVIRKSTLWNEAIRVLTEGKAEGFNFEIELGGKTYNG